MMIPYGRQDIDQNDIDAVIETLTSDYLTQGPKVPEFEQALAVQSQSKHAIATCNATAALHIACLALEVKKDDIVWTSPVTFVASANCALYCGANIDFVDIDIATGNISLSALKTKLEMAAKKNALPKVIIAVHLAGQSCPMQQIYELTQLYGIKLVEDASHAVGAQYKGKPVGNCQYSDITIFSFHPVKIITTAEGGMALTNCDTLAKNLRSLRSHGITNNPNEMTEESHGPWYYQQLSLGFNYRMTELQAALGLSQLTRLTKFVTARNKLAQVYQTAFKGSGIQCLTPDKSSLSAFHLFIILLPIRDTEYHRKSIVKLREKGICAHLHYIPIHLQPYYQELGFKKGDFPSAEEYYQRAITLPLHPNLTTEEQQHIIQEVKALI